MLSLMTTTTTFDAAKFKETTKTQWDAAAEAWHRWGPTLEKWLGPATEHMLDLARVASGCRVLDIAAGAAQQTLQAAARVGPGGSVLATDLSPEILEHAGAEAKRAGHAKCLRFQKESFGALHQMLSGLDSAGREAAWAEVATLLREQERGADGYVGPCELIVAVGTR
jgi:cyclopropane fatty-acyl-phospholipid synthase-like methyltransferase